MFSDFNNYSKWFALHNYDYSIHSKAEKFKATATLRGFSTTLESGVFDSPQEAVHALYLVVKDLSSPVL